jgi:hypothetical protein
MQRLLSRHQPQPSWPMQAPQLVEREHVAELEVELLLDGSSMQVLLWQVRPRSHLLLAQQGVPSSPQGAQVPRAQA